MNFISHIPALLIVLPLVAAPLCVIARNSLLAFLLAVSANAIVFLMAIYLFFRTVLMSGLYNIGASHYELGGWSAPTGIEFYVDILNAALVLLLTLISLLALCFSKKSIQKEIPEYRHYLFYAGWLLCLTGLLGISLTGDVFNVFVFLEISSLSMYMLIAMGKDKKHAVLAAFRYLILGSIGASFILLGIGFLYAATGTLNMFDLSQRLPDIENSRTLLVAFSFIAVGLFVKTAIFPVYSWLPDAYQYAPSSVTAFLSGTATKVSLYVFLRFFFHIFGTDYSFGVLFLGKLLLPLSVVGFSVMSVIAIFQTDIRRMLAYSSIAQISYIMMAISMGTEAGLVAGIVHMINHAFIKTALFLAVGCIFYRLGSARVTDMSSLIRLMPWTTSAFIIAALSLIGIPLTAGFISKWYLVLAAIDSGWWLIVLMILFSSLMAIIYLGRIIELMCSGNQQDNVTDIREAPLSMLIPLWILILISLTVGINGSFVVDIAQLAADQLLGGME
ncbi:MAG: multicomponent Na+:H+ antiporter subunit D [Cellvibrionaceae bacterium]